MKKKFPEVLKRGMKLSVILIVAAVLIGLVSKYRNQNSNPSADKAEKSETSGPVMCRGLKKPVLSRETTPVRQVIRRDCFSAVHIPPSSARSKVAIDHPGAIEVCYWRINRCAAWASNGDGQLKEKVRGEIPDDYTDILMRGDPGTAEIHLLR